MIRNILFDGSGTLVDDLPAVLDSTNHVLVRADRPEMTLDEFRSGFCRAAHFTLLNYTCRVAGSDEVRLNEEAQTHRWLALLESLNLALNRPIRVLLEAAIARAETPIGLTPTRVNAA